MIGLLAVISFTTSALFGCSGGSTKVNPEDLEKEYPNDVQYEITILTYEHWDPTYKRSWDLYGMNKIKQKALEPEYNLNLQFEEVVANDEYAKTIVNTRLAAQVDVPDVIRLDFNGVEINNLYNTGMILNLSDYEDYMPNINAVFEEWPSLKTQHALPEGDIIAIPKATYNIQRVTYWGDIRKDWLDKLGLSVPTTTTEFRNALQAFQTNNVNGKADQKEQYYAPYTAMNTSLGPAFGAYGIVQANNSWAADDKGNIYHAMLTDEARNYLEYVAGMFRDGLFWEGSLSASSDAVSSMRLDDRFAGNYDNYWGALSKNMVDYSQGRTHTEYVTMYPLTDGEHPQVITHRQFAGETPTVITSWCDAPHRVIKFFDWLMSEEGFETVYYGETMPGGNYFTDEPVINKLTAEEANALGVTEETTTVMPTEKFNQEFGTSTNYPSVLGLYRENFWPFYVHSTSLDIALEYYFEYPRETTKSASDLLPNFQRLTWAEDEANIFYEPLFASPTNEEQEILKETSDLFTYMDEMFQKFMMNIEPLSKWDEFKAQCEALGVEKAQKVYQKRYDRMK